VLPGISRDNVMNRRLTHLEPFCDFVGRESFPIKSSNLQNLLFRKYTTGILDSYPSFYRKGEDLGKPTLFR